MGAMMRLRDIKIATRVYAGLGVILACVAAIGLMNRIQTEKIWHNTVGLYEHPLIVRGALHHLHADILTIFIDMKELVLLDEEKAKSDLIKEVRALEARINPHFQVLYESYLGPHGDIDRIRQEYTEWSVVRAENIRLVQEGKSAEALSRVRHAGEGGKLLLKLNDGIRVISDFASAKGDKFYNDAIEQKKRLEVRTVSLTISVFLLTALVGYFLVKGLTVPLKQLMDAINQYRQGRLDARCSYSSDSELGKLSAQFNEMAQTVQVELTMRKKAEEELALHVAQLESANRELDSFSYSVAHDLRAPLRSMEGFSAIILDECGDKLDERGKDYMQRVRSAAAIMVDLIEDMLDLSRIGRKEMAVNPVDLTRIARDICSEFAASSPDRAVELVIQDNVVAKGDEALLSIALRNILQNAWKFTAKHRQAKIEFGVRTIGREKAYFVRDDGAGFDMAYSNKLFGAFQRLHSKIEFSGTGIGLAIVQRIISRHGGRVWAESEVEKGAVFYFTLP